MKKIAALFALLFASLAAHAAAPTEQSIDRLLNDIQVEKILDALKPQMDSMMRQVEQQAEKGNVPSAEDQKVIDKFHAKVINITAENLTMAKLRPLYVRVYSENFTQEEVDGLTAFLESPAGKAYVTKLPMVMQSVMGEMPKLLAPMMQEIQKAGKEMSDELVSLHKQGTK